MKTVAVLIAGLVAVQSVNAQPANVTVTPTLTPAAGPALNTTSGHGAQIQSERRCYAPNNNVPPRWYRLTKADGPHTCLLPPLSHEWAMLKSYRDGGIQNVHWKYTNDPKDPECMLNWNYHAADGRTLKTYVAGRTTFYGQDRRWCGLPVYNDGGVEGFQWAFCNCI